MTGQLNESAIVALRICFAYSLGRDICEGQTSLKRLALEVNITKGA